MVRTTLKGFDLFNLIGPLAPFLQGHTELVFWEFSAHSDPSASSVQRDNIDLDNMYIRFNFEKERHITGNYVDQAYILEKAGGLWTSVIAVGFFILKYWSGKNDQKVAQEMLTKKSSRNKSSKISEEDQHHKEIE